MNDKANVPDPRIKAAADPDKSSVWLGFATREVTERQTVRIRLRWGRISATLLVLGMMVWFVKSFAFYYFFKEVRDFQEVTVSDMIAFPLNRSNVKKQQGNYQIEQGLQALEREDYRLAIGLLQEGLARSKGNVEGRMTLAQIYSGWQPQLAIDLLTEGIPFGKEDPDYIRLTGQVLLSQKADNQLLDITEELLQEDLQPEVKKIVTVIRLQAASLLGKYDMVRDLFEETDIKGTLDGVILGTQLYSKTGQYELAADILVSAIQALPEENQTPLIARLTEVYLAQEDYEKARETALLLVVRDPMSWPAKLALIETLDKSGLNERRDLAMAAVLNDHRNEEAAMTRLSQLSASYGNVATATSLYEVALENGFSLSSFTLGMAEAFITAERYDEAVALFNQLVQEDPSWMVNSEGPFNALRSLAYLGQGDEELGNIYFKNLLESKLATPLQFYAVAQKFKSQGRLTHAYQILSLAHEKSPKDEKILVDLIDIEMEIGEFFALREHLEALSTLRRPEYSQIENIRTQLQSDQFIFTEGRSELLEKLSAILAEKDLMNWEIWERQAAEG